MAQEIGKLFRVKKQVQGVVPSTQNSEYFELINLGGSGNVDQSAVVNTYKEDTQFKTGDILLVEEEVNETVLIGTKVPIPPYHIQFAKIDGTFDDNEEPTNWYKKMYGIDTTWELMFNTDSVAFITEGSYSNDNRSDGIQGDAIRNISGKVGYQEVVGLIDPSFGGYTNGCFNIDVYKNKTHATNAYDRTTANIAFNASNVVPTASVNRMRNRLIRVYHLLSINGVN